MIRLIHQKNLKKLTRGLSENPSDRKIHKAFNYKNNGYSAYLDTLGKEALIKLIFSLIEYETTTE